MQSFLARVAAIRDLTHDVRQIDLALLDPPEMAFSAGQFVSFEVDRPGFPRPVTRAYSIASPPEHRRTIQLVLNLVPGGPGSGYLFGLHDGEETEFKGPVGSFTLRDTSRDVLFVVTGTGIAPVRSMLWSLALCSSRRRLTLLWGLRSERDLYYQEELAALQNRLPNFSFTTTLSQPTASWRGSIGRVTPLVAATVSDVSGLDVYLCGNGGMIRDVRDLLRRKGLCPIYTEQYYK